METEEEIAVDVSVPLDESNADLTNAQLDQPNPDAQDNNEVTEQVQEDAASPDKIQVERPDGTFRKVSVPTQIGEINDTSPATPEDNDDQQGGERSKTGRTLRFTVVQDSDASVPISKVEAAVEAELDSKETAISTPSRLSYDSVLEVEDIEKLVGEDDNLDALSSNLQSDYDDDSDDEDDFLKYEDDISDDKEVSGYGLSIDFDSVKAHNDFLDNFVVPSLSNLSMDSEEGSRRSKLSIAESINIDVGRFVDPISGLTIDSHHSFSSPEISEEITLDLESQGMTPRESLDYDDLWGMRKSVVINEEPEDVFTRFTKVIEETRTSEDSEEERERTKLHREALQIALDFLFDILKNVVKKAENVTPENLSKNKLDKKRLIETLIHEKDNYLYEKELNTFLNARMGDYYRRLRNNRPLMRLPDSIYHQEHEKYTKSLLRLDYFLKLQATTKTKFVYLLSSVVMDLAFVSNIVKKSEQHLESVMLTVLGSKSEHIRHIIEHQLEHMGNLRNVISDTRLSLITKKHTLARMREKADSLEYIDGNICMEDFLSIQNQISAMFKKIEDRNIELKRLQFHYHSELHTVQHTREKTLAIARKLSEHKKYMRKRLEKQRLLRERLYKAKMERGRLRKQHSDLIYQGGLLSLPALMLDYDDTVEKVESKHASINEMKETLARLSRRLNHLESFGI